MNNQKSHLHKISDTLFLHVDLYGFCYLKRLIKLLF